MEHLTIITLSLISVCFLETGGFNLYVEPGKPVVHTSDETNSWFGFSVAQHIIGRDSWVLVGAPRAPLNSRNSTQVGQVFQCDSTNPSSCEHVQLDANRELESTWSGADSQRKKIETKMGEYLGSTVDSMNGVLMACAPRYIYHGPSTKKREGIGRCIVKRPNLDPTTFVPCREVVNNGYLNDDPYHCEVGFSASLTKNGSKVAMGAPGGFYWQGQLTLEDIASHTFLETKEDLRNHKQVDYTYMAYAMAVGYLSGPDTEAYALSSPRRHNFRGRVTVHREESNILEPVSHVIGEQIGEYFGYSVAAVDLNGDGLDDLVVGAPMYTDYDEGLYEVGRVFIYYQNTNSHNFQQDNKGLDIIRGSKTGWARFGSAVASLGDLDQDGKEDLAVGAPYEGNGVVYIYHGGYPSIRTEPIQVVAANDISPLLRTFGFSLSGGTDMDENEYPDLVIGAYEADTTVYLRSKPVIRMSATITSSPTSIKFEEKQCDLGRVACYYFTVCLGYTGVGLPERIGLQLDFELEPGSSRPSRAYFRQGGLSTYRRFQGLQKNPPNNGCMEQMEVRLRDDIEDRLSPIWVNLTYSLLDDGDIEPPPMLDIYSQTSVVTKTEFWKDCGTDAVCVPDLTINVTSPSPPYKLETEATIEVEVQLRNDGDDAYLVEVSIQLPPGTSYINVQTKQARRNVQCSYQEGGLDGNTVVCDVGNPLRSSELSIFVVRFSPARFQGSTETLRFIATATSFHAEDAGTTGNNVATVYVPVLADARLQLTGLSDPEQIVFDDTWKRPEYIGDIPHEVDHIYEVRNLGPSQIASIAVEILWPSFLSGNQDLLYLTLAPDITDGSGSCDYDSINRLGLKKGNASNEDEPSGGRNKREITDEKEEELRTIRCESGSEMCVKITCTINGMAKDDSTFIHINSRLWTDTLVKAEVRAMSISSSATARVVDVPYAAVKPDVYAHDTVQVKTSVLNSARGVASIELWIIILAASLGILLLIVIVLVLWKCGFFKRSKPPTEPMDDKTEKPNKQESYDNAAMPDSSEC